MMERRLMRSRRSRMIAGVCGGIAEYTNTDPTIVRLVWALITLLGYLGVLHARSAGWIGHRGLAAWSVACFAMVVMAWYGVNLMGPGGLHDYGLGGDAAAYYIFAAIALELLYVVASSLSMTSLSWQSE